MEWKNQGGSCFDDVILQTFPKTVSKMTSSKQIIEPPWEELNFQCLRESKKFDHRKISSLGADILCA